MAKQERNDRIAELLACANKALDACNLYAYHAFREAIHNLRQVKTTE